MDLPTILFYSLCVIAFLIGVWIWQCLFPARSLSEEQLTVKMDPVIFVALPLVAAIAGSLISNYLLLRNNPNILLLLLAQQGRQLKGVDALDDQGTMVFMAPILNGILWWAFFRIPQLKLSGIKRTLLWAGVLVGILASLLSATLKLSRANLLLVFCGLTVLYIYRRASLGKLSTGSALRVLAIFPLTIALLFGSFALLRGSEGIDVVGNQLAGYSIASYNRLAAVVNGKLQYPYSGTGKTLFSAITTSKAIAKVLPFRDAMNLPDNADLFGGDFSAVSRAGLDPTLVWSGAFGYIFSDLGWYSPWFLFGYGLLYGYIWQSLLKKNLVGILIYPWAAFAILFWIGGNYLTDSSIIYLGFCGISLGVYERKFLVRSHATI
ncbi:MAG: hypothetical protein JSS95_10730 [Acidobacteria bacterium]|nr:hypothetical protein [Acidobacteriota bacterium]